MIHIEGEPKSPVQSPKNSNSDGNSRKVSSLPTISMSQEDIILSKLFDELRDILESDAFYEMYRDAMKFTLENIFLKHLKAHIEESGVEKESNVVLPIGKLVPFFIREYEAIVKSDDNEYIAAFSDVPNLIDYCEAVSAADE